MYFSLLSPNLLDWHVSAQRRGAAAPEEYVVNPRTLQLEPIARGGVQRTAAHRRPAASSAAGLQTGQAGGSSQGQAMQPQQVPQRRRASAKPAHAAGKAVGKARAQVLPVCHPHGCTVTCLAASYPILSGSEFNMQITHSPPLQLPSLARQGVPDLTGGPAASQRSSDMGSRVCMLADGICILHACCSGHHHKRRICERRRRLAQSP